MLCCTYVIRYSLSVRLTPYLFTGVVVTAVRSNGLVATVSAPTAYLCPLGCTRPRPGPTTERGSSRSPTDRQSRHAEQLVVVANGAAQRASVGAKDSLASALNWTRSRPWKTIANHTFLVRGVFHVDGRGKRCTRGVPRRGRHDITRQPGILAASSESMHHLPRCGLPAYIIYIAILRRIGPTLSHAQL